MSLLAGLDREFRPWAEWIYSEARHAGLNPRITSGFRSMSSQGRLYRAYLAGRHPLPVARPGCSQHNFGWAIDMVSDDNARLGAIWQRHGGYWGGTRDPVHFGTSWFPCA